MKHSLILFCILFLASCILAEEIPVNIKAETLKYIEDTGVIHATGSVEVNLKDAYIKADSLFIDPNTNIATAEGNVYLITKKHRAKAGSFTYNITTEVSSFVSFEGTAGSGIYLRAGKLEEKDKNYFGEQGLVTTCDYGEEHYYNIAQKVEYYPGDKIIGYNVTTYVGRVPVFWSPYLIYDDNDKWKTNWQFGHNEVEGDYVKSSWRYPLGMLYLDYMEKKGFGKGASLDYAVAGLGLGSLYLYHLQENDTNITDWVTRIRHSKQLDANTKLNFNHDYTVTYLIPSGRRDQTGVNLNLNHKSEAKWNLKLDSLDDRMSSLGKYSLGLNHYYDKATTNYFYDYNYLKKDPKWLRLSQRLYHRRPLGFSNGNFTTRINYSSNKASEGAPADQIMEPMVELTGKEKDFSWKLTENWYVDVDGGEYTGDNNHQYLEKLPELDINLNSYDAKLFRIRPSFGYGYYHEVKYLAAMRGNRDFATSRYRGTLNADKSFTVGRASRLTLRAGLDQFQYGPGDQLYAYRESARLRTNAGGFFRNNIDYKKGYTNGNTPFLFDQIGTRYHSLNESATLYYKTYLNWNTTGGYNWQTFKWFDAMTRLSIRPSSVFGWNLRTGWDLENKVYKDLVQSLTLNPATYLGLQFATVSDLNNGDMKSGSISYDFLLLEGQKNEWKVRLRQVWDTASKEFKLRDIMVVKDLHCWQLTYTYSDYRKEFSLKVSLDAFPSDPVGFATGKGFNYEGAERRINEMKNELKPEGSIKRY